MQVYPLILFMYSEQLFVFVISKCNVCSVAFVFIIEIAFVHEVDMHVYVCPPQTSG